LGLDGVLGADGECSFGAGFCGSGGGDDGGRPPPPVEPPDGEEPAPPPGAGDDGGRVSPPPVEPPDGGEPVPPPGAGAAGGVAGFSEALPAPSPLLASLNFVIPSMTLRASWPLGALPSNLLELTTTNWRWDGDGVVRYPLQLVGLAIILPQKVLQLKTWEPPRTSAIYIRDITVGSRPSWVTWSRDLPGDDQ
jgi:hypothetical protein